MADSTLTLLRRMRAKEPILSAHRTHFYQRGVAAGLTVPQVTARVLLLQILLAALAIATVLFPTLAVALPCVGLGVLATGVLLYALAHGR
jgi:UDP-N-acetylmuramyl pentapeptide phosphotransferase/UDP-N-acetylglucosamine-1-phosphate transferase